eukprot:1386381-Amorphochlora_amoeboformis.AAC.2
MRDGVSGRLRPHAHLVFLWVIFVTLRAFPSTRTLSRRDAWLGARPLGRYEGLLNVPVKEDNPTEATDGPGGPFDERKVNVMNKMTMYTECLGKSGSRNIYVWHCQHVYTYMRN